MRKFAKSKQQNWKTKNDGLLLKVKQGQFMLKLVRLGWLGWVGWFWVYCLVGWFGWLVWAPIERETFEEQMEDNPLLTVRFRSLENWTKRDLLFSLRNSFATYSVKYVHCTTDKPFLNIVMSLSR